MSTYAAPPDAVPGMGGLSDPGALPPHPGDPSSMAALAAALGASPGGPTDGGGLPPGLSDPGGGGLPPDPTGGPGEGPGEGGGSDLLSGMNATDHIRAAIKHLMMAMTEATDDTQSHGITKGMAALHGILAAKQKSDSTVAAAGGTPAGG